MDAAAQMGLPAAALVEGLAAARKRDADTASALKKAAQQDPYDGGTTGHHGCPCFSEVQLVYFLMGYRADSKPSFVSDSSNLGLFQIASRSTRVTLGCKTDRRAGAATLPHMIAQHHLKGATDIKLTS